MSSRNRLLFDSSVAALGLVSARQGAPLLPLTRDPASTSRRIGRSATATSIHFAPEPDPAANVVDLGEGQTTGPLPVGFEFELFGVRYTRLELSSDGFVTFGTAPSPDSSGGHPGSRFIPLNSALDNFIALGWPDGYLSGPSQVAFEVRGAFNRRRLVLSITPALPCHRDLTGTAAVQLVLHERTGMIDVHTTRLEPVARGVNREAVRFTTAPH
ncbi:MAG TPA: hypothetical protein VGP44_05580 [Gemmatimonadales bacterium]|nr:hypothetical protein [Gemmatimonadales bacterium]